MADTEEPKDAPKSKSDRLWIFLGKVGVLLGVIATAAGLWNAVTTPKGKLVGYVQYAPFSTPPVAARYESQIRDAQAKVREELVKLNVKPAGEIFKQLMSDPEFFVKEVRREVKSSAGLAESILYVEVSNQGDSTLKDVRLIVGQSFGSGTIARAGHELETIISPYEKKRAAQDVGLDVFDDLLNEVRLGDMPPASEAKVTLFLLTEPIWFREVQLVHESGKGKVFMPEYSYSAGEWLRKKWNETPTAFLLWLTAAACLGGLIVYWIQRQQRRTAAS